MSAMDATYHAAQDLIYVLQNPSPASPLAKLGHLNKEQLKTLAKIFRKANPPALPSRVPVMEVGQIKLQEVNQKRAHMKRSPQSNQITNSEPLRLTIAEVYPNELQPVNQAKNKYFSSQ